MGFFKRRDKRLAKHSKLVLQDCYKSTEIGLKKAVASGDEKAMKEAMRKHRDVEYAMLYQNTPEYKSKQKVIIRKSKTPVREECKYNAQIYTDVGNGFAYTGNGKFFKTKKEANRFKNQIKRRK